MLSAVHNSCRGQWWESRHFWVCGIPINSIQQECWSNPIPSAMGAPSERAASVVFSWRQDCSLPPHLPGKKPVSNPRSPETALKGKRLDMGSSERGLVDCSHLSAPWHPGQDVSAGASWRRAALQGRSLSFCWQPPPTGVKYQQKLE